MKEIAQLRLLLRSYACYAILALHNLLLIRELDSPSVLFCFVFVFGLFVLFLFLFCFFVSFLVLLWSLIALIPLFLLLQGADNHHMWAEPKNWTSPHICGVMAWWLLCAGMHRSKQLRAPSRKMISNGSPIGSSTLSSPCWSWVLRLSLHGTTTTHNFLNHLTFFPLKANYESVTDFVQNSTLAD